MNHFRHVEMKKKKLSANVQKNQNKNDKTDAVGMKIAHRTQKYLAHELRTHG